MSVNDVVYAISRLDGCRATNEEIEPIAIDAMDKTKDIQETGERAYQLVRRARKQLQEMGKFNAQ